VKRLNLSSIFSLSEPDYMAFGVRFSTLFAGNKNERRRLSASRSHCALAHVRCYNDSRFWMKFHPVKRQQRLKLAAFSGESDYENHRGVTIKHGVARGDRARRNRR
jgi:hypothetical protein